MNKHQHLIECLVGPDESNLSKRFIDADQFELWQYRLRHHHKLRVYKPVSCLWMSTEEAKDWPANMGEQQPVTRMVFANTNQFGARLEQVRYFEANQSARLKTLVGGQLFGELPNTPWVEEQMGVVVSPVSASYA